MNNDSVYARVLRGDEVTSEEYETLTMEERRSIKWGGCPPDIPQETIDRVQRVEDERKRKLKQ